MMTTYSGWRVLLTVMGMRNTFEDDEMDEYQPEGYVESWIDERGLCFVLDLPDAPLDASCDDVWKYVASHVPQYFVGQQIARVYLVTNGKE